jgi:hypothetical protein
MDERDTLPSPREMCGYRIADEMQARELLIDFEYEHPRYDCKFIALNERRVHLLNAELIRRDLGGC